VWSNLGKSHAIHSHLALQGPFGTAEGRETMTTTLETPLEVNADPLQAFTAMPSFHSLTRNASLLQPNFGKSHAIHNWLSRTHLALPRAAKP